MTTESLVEADRLCQYRIVLQPGEQFGQEASEISRTLYVLCGVGTIQTPSQRLAVQSAGFYAMEPNTPYTLTNTNLFLLTFLLTQVA